MIHFALQKSGEEIDGEYMGIEYSFAYSQDEDSKSTASGLASKDDIGKDGALV